MHIQSLPVAPSTRKDTLGYIFWPTPRTGLQINSRPFCSRSLGRLVLLLVVRVFDLGLLKVSRWDTTDVENLQFSVTSILGLGDKEPSKDDDSDGGTEPDESTLTLEVPGEWIEGVRVDVLHTDRDGIVARSSDGASLSTELDG